MVEQTQIDKWKKEHGKVYVARPASDIEVYYRTLTREDYINIMQESQTSLNMDPELKTVQLCVLHGFDIDSFTKRGGLTTVIYEDIMVKSGFVVIESEEL